LKRKGTIYFSAFACLSSFGKTHILLKSYGNSIMATFFTETNIIDGKIR